MTLSSNAQVVSSILPINLDASKLDTSSVMIEASLPTVEEKWGRLQLEETFSTDSSLDYGRNQPPSISSEGNLKELKAALAKEKKRMLQKDSEIAMLVQNLKNNEVKFRDLETAFTQKQMEYQVQAVDHSEKIARLLLALSESKREAAGQQKEVEEREDSDSHTGGENSETMVLRRRLAERQEEVRKLQISLAEELAQRKAAQYEVIKQTKIALDLQTQLAEKDKTIQELQNWDSLHRSQSTGRRQSSDARISRMSSSAARSRSPSEARKDVSPVPLNSAKGCMPSSVELPVPVLTKLSQIAQAASTFAPATVDSHSHAGPVNSVRAQSPAQTTPHSCTREVKTTLASTRSLFSPASSPYMVSRSLSIPRNTTSFSYQAPPGGSVKIRPQAPSGVQTHPPSPPSQPNQPSQPSQLQPVEVQTTASRRIEVPGKAYPVEVQTKTYFWRQQSSGSMLVSPPSSTMRFKSNGVVIATPREIQCSRAAASVSSMGPHLNAGYREIVGVVSRGLR
eukprot:TRINITY_DN109198_c0_g1_i1.p1 TRINITY_DN109198_c0_g1~~TRINITY_DN109198_c0_g1_i1.p1  ORF type:complete len:521 (-),score=105.13 TRINITY_DN109198_c0_g1_i1:850-2379(-)